MAKVKEIKEKEDVVISSQDQLATFLKNNEKDHLNFENEEEYKIAPKSLTLTSLMGGGMSAGSMRFIGVPSGGKTSAALDFMSSFLKRGKGHKAIYIKAEGRLGTDMKTRTGINFTDNFSEWSDGTCFVFHSNVYEAVFGLIRELITNNPSKTKYFFVVDSINMLGRRDDLAKPFEESQQVAGGALLTSDFFRKTAMAMSRRGHICIFISQVRDAISINAYGPAPTRQGKSSGPHSLEHQGEWVIDFLPRFNDDIIRENPNDKNSKPIGHYCKLNIIKSPNEKYNFKVQYPIKYGRTGGNSIWVEREIVDLLLGSGLIEKKGAWFNFLEVLVEEVKKNLKIDISEKIQGLDNVYAFIENNEELKNYLFKKLVNLLCG